MNHYLVVFDRSEGRVLRLEQFHDPRKALAARFEAERLHRGNRNIEIVVLGAESESDLRSTHARYFEDLRKLTSEALRRTRTNAATRGAAAYC